MDLSYPAQHLSDLATRYRRRHAQSSWKIIPTCSSTSDGSPTPEDHLIRLDNQAAVNEALDRLQPLLREVLLLCDVEELKYKDIALVLDVPIGTVMSRISRARRSLYQLLQSQHRGIAMTQLRQVTGHLDPDQINAFVDGELSPSEAHEMQQHLADAIHAPCAFSPPRSSKPPLHARRNASPLRPKHSPGSQRSFARRKRRSPHASIASAPRHGPR